MSSLRSNSIGCSWRGCAWLLSIVIIGLAACAATLLYFRPPSRISRGTEMAIDAKDDDLINAVKAGDAERVDKLIKAGGDRNARHAGSSLKDEWALPIHLACFHGHVDVVRVLIKSGVNPNVGDVYGKMPLFYAICSNSDDEASRVECVRCLVRAGANIEAPLPSTGSRPLDYAVIYWDAEVVDALLRLGASVNATGPEGRTPLHSACVRQPYKRFCKPITKLLLEHGADVNAVDSLGNTPLHWACRASPSIRDEPLIRLLLSYGANPMAKNHDGRTPTDYVGKPQMEELRGGISNLR